MQVADMVFSWMKLGTFIFSNGCHALGFAVLLSNMKTSTLSWWVLLASRLSLGVNLSNIFVVHYMRGRLLLMPIEFHHIHVKRLELLRALFSFKEAEVKLRSWATPCASGSRQSWCPWWSIAPLRRTLAAGRRPPPVPLSLVPALSSYEILC